VSGSSDVNTTTAGIDPVPTKSPSCRWTVVASADSGRYAVASLLDTSSTLPKYGPPTAAAASQAEMISAGNAILSQRRPPVVARLLVEGWVTGLFEFMTTHLYSL